MKEVQGKHSRLGVVSFIFGLIPLVCIAVTAIHDILYPYGGRQVSRYVVLIFTILMLLNAVGLIIGIMAVCRKGVRKGFGIWGIILNSIIPLIIIATELSR